MKKLSVLLGIPLLFAVLAACAPMTEESGATDFTLSGSQEVPAVETAATGSGTATLAGNMLSVSGEFSGLSSPLFPVAGTPGHVHMAPAGENGDVVFLVDVVSADGMNGTFSLSTELTPEQIASYNAGDFYVNFHTEMNNGGELRGQLGASMADMSGM